MRKFLPIVLIIIAACVVFFLWNSSSDLDGLGGEAWTVFEFNGKKVVGSTDKVSFTKGKATWKVMTDEGPEEIETGFRYDAAKKPKEIDLSLPGDPRRLLPGIYKIEGEFLIVCLGSERPTEFIGGANRKTTLLVFKR